MEDETTRRIKEQLEVIQQDVKADFDALEQKWWDETPKANIKVVRSKKGRITGTTPANTEAVVKKKLNSQRVSRRRAIWDTVGVTSLLLIAACGVNQLTRPRPELNPLQPDSQAVPATPIIPIRQTAAEMVEKLMEDAAKNNRLVSRDQLNRVVRQWQSEISFLNKDYPLQKAIGTSIGVLRNQFADQITVGAKIALLNPEGSVFSVGGDGRFYTKFNNYPESYDPRDPEQAIIAANLVQLGIMRIYAADGITYPERYIPESYIADTVSLGRLVKFELNEDFGPFSNQYNLYPILYRQLRALSEAGKPIPKVLRMAKHENADIQNQIAEYNNPLSIVPRYTLEANQTWAEDYKKAAIVDGRLVDASRRGIHYANPEALAEQRFMEDLDTYFDGIKLRQSNIGMLESKESSLSEIYAGQRFAELYNILRQGLDGVEYTKNAHEKVYNETYVKGEFVRVIDIDQDGPEDRLLLRDQKSFERPSVTNNYLYEGDIVELTGNSEVVRSKIGLVAVRLFPIRGGHLRFRQLSNGSIYEEKTANVISSWWDHEWLGEVMSR